MKAFLVDDEFLQRKLVKKSVDWQRRNSERMDCKINIAAISGKCNLSWRKRKTWTGYH